MRSKFRLMLQAPKYKLHRRFGWPKTLPVNLTVSVTNLCNSRCKTCYIWKLYLEKPSLKNSELKTYEFERIFESLGDQVFWATISGGEPFLRQDLPQICEALYEHCKPAIINIPTNALLPAVIEARTRQILEKCPDAEVIVNLSLDGIGKEHDEIRGVPGNFEKLINTYERLKLLKETYLQLKVGIHTVVSKFNVQKLPELYQYVIELDPDSFISEVAERRTELFNVDKDVTPPPDIYAKAMIDLSKTIRKNFLINPDSSKVENSS